MICSCPAVPLRLTILLPPARPTLAFIGVSEFEVLRARFRWGIFEGGGCVGSLLFMIIGEFAREDAGVGMPLSAVGSVVPLACRPP